MKKVALILIVAVTLRLFLSAISFHSDIAVFDFAGRVINQGYILSLYDYLFKLPPDSLILRTYPVYLFNYPPAIYFFHSVFTFIFNPLFNQEFLQSFLFDTGSSLQNPQIFFHLLFLKLPFIFIDLLAGWLIWNLFSSKRLKLIGLLLWLFNPINLYATYLMGQFDILPTTSLVAALFILKRYQEKGLFKAALILGLGASFKIFPFFLLIPLASEASSLKKRGLILLTGFLPYIIQLIPFLTSKGFRTSALVANQTTKSLYAQIPVSGGESIILFISVIIFLYIFFLVKQGINFYQKSFLTLLTFFIFTHTHPQWLLWLSPFLIIDLVENNFRNLLPTIIILIVFLAQLTFFDPGLTIGLFAPLNSTLYNGPSIWENLHLSIDYNIARSFIHSIFVGTSLYYIYYLASKKNLS